MAKKKKEKEPSVKLSPKHGLNPTMGICFYCEEPTGEIALLGKLKGDVEAPKYAVFNYEPCEKCKERWGDDVALIAVTEEKLWDNRPPIFKANGDRPDLYPTGNYVVVKADAAEKMFNIKKGTKVGLIAQSVLDEIIPKDQPIKKA